MDRTRRFTSLAALALLAGCGQGQQPSNVTPAVQTGDSNVYIPDGNADAVNATANAVEANVVTPVTVPAVDLAPDGLRLVAVDGSAHPLNFGVARADAGTALTPLLGAGAKPVHNDECGGGAIDSVDYKAGLTLYYQDDKFVGWQLDGRAHGPYATASGIGLGSTLATMRGTGEVSVAETSLGHEFSMGELSGLLDANRADGKVTELWAGVTCIFR